MDDKWIATTNSKTYYEHPDFKPQGMWKCRACGTVQHGSTLYQDPQSTAIKWTCSDLTCGGTCEPAPAAQEDET